MPSSRSNLAHRRQLRALQLLIAWLLGIPALAAYAVALAYLNVSQVLSELGLPALLVRDLAARAWHYLRLRTQAAAPACNWRLRCWHGRRRLLPALPCACNRAQPSG